MKTFDKNRTRLLVICQDQQLTNNLVTLLTSYGYYVDYCFTRKEGILKFKQYKQAIVIFEAALLPKYPGHLFRIFKIYSNNPKILIAAREDQESKIYPYLNNAVYDIIQVPLRFEYLDFCIRRLIAYDNLMARHEFLVVLSRLIAYSSPLWIYFIVVLVRRSLGYY
jgi:DNA-binding response OmpR family regulator